MTKEAPTSAEIFCEQIARSLGFKGIEDLSRTITLGRAVQDYVSALAPAAKAPASGPRFVKLADGIVRDNTTGLEWDTADFDGKTFTFEKAQKACADLRTGGHSDWRLPTIQELLSLVDYERSNPAIDKEFFPNCVSGYYRTSTPYTPYPGDAWGVRFGDGYSYCGHHVSSYYVRAVRASQS